MFKANFEKLCIQNGEAPSSVCGRLGMNRSSYSGWDENTIPRKTTLIKIADYFGVTVEDLLRDDGETKKPPTVPKEGEGLDEHERALLEMYRGTDPITKASIMVKVKEIVDEAERAALKKYTDKTG